MFPTDDELTSLLADLRGQIQLLFLSYKIPPSDVEDLLQEALLSIACSWGKVRNRKAWLMQALRFQCYGYLRRNRYGDALIPVDPKLLEEMVLDESRVARQDLQLHLEKLASALPPTQRAMLRLRFVAGMTQTEVARCLGYQQSSVNRGLVRALRQLKTAYDRS
jgi:RNA polymerase sigma factor (sigma-70 family)